MEPLLYFLAGTAAGAACMWCSCVQARNAAENERKRAEKREARFSEERFALRADADNAREGLARMQIEQANSAGYMDGYNAGRRDAENEQVSEFANGILKQGLQDGKRVSWTIFNR